MSEETKYVNILLSFEVPEQWAAFFTSGAFMFKHPEAVRNLVIHEVDDV